MATTVKRPSESAVDARKDSVVVSGDVVLLRGHRGFLAIERAAVSEFSLDIVAGALQIRAGIVSGWIVAPSPVERVEILIAGKAATETRPDLPRPDVAAAFPNRPDLAHVGYSATLRGVAMPTSVRPEVTVVAHLANGSELRVSRTVTLPSRSEAAKPTLPPLRMNVEVADLTADGTLLVSGWIAAQEAVVAVQVHAGNQRIGVAEGGLPREDVAAAFPEYPHAGNGGFAFSRTLGTAILDGVTTLQVECLTVHGQSHRTVVPLRRIEPTPASGPQQRTFHQETQVDQEEQPHRIACNIDNAVLTVTGVLRVEGWAFSPGTLQEIEVLLDGASVGTVVANRPRLDVGKQYPTLASARSSGFLFETQLDGEYSGEHRLKLAFTDTEGDRREEDLLLPAITAEVLAAIAEAPGNEAIKLEVEEPAQRNGKATEIIRGAITISGWALAREGIDRIEVEIDGVLAGTAYYGRGRYDVEAAFPDWPNSLFSGYALSVPAKVLSNGIRNFMVRAYDKTGTTAEHHFIADVDKAEVEAGPQLLRQRMPYLELQTAQRVLQAAGYEPNFRFLLLAEGGKAGLDKVMATLASLHRQAWPHWQAAIILSGRRRPDRPAEALRRLVELEPERIALLHAADCDDLAEFARHGPAAWWHRRRSPPPALFGLLRAGDELGMDALIAAALANCGRERADLLYADDRRHSVSLQAEAAFFKPDWSPDLMLAQNYLGRAWLATPELLAKAGARATELARRGEYDLSLRLTEAAGTIRHIPQVLFRMAPGSDSPEQEQAALAATLDRRGIPGSVLPTNTPGVWRVRREVTRPGLVSIIMPSIAARGHVKVCIESIREKTHYRNFEIILIDNIRGEALSEEQIAWKAWFRQQADLVIPVDEGFNWSRFNNIGAAQAKGEYLLFLNDDIEVLDPHWLDSLLEHAQREEVGVVGPLLLYADLRVQHAGMFLSRTTLGQARHAFRFAQDDDPGYFGLCAGQRNVIAVTGACLMSRREIYDRLGGFDEAHSVINNDLDYCLRTHRAGLRCVYTPHTRLIHHELASRARVKEDFDLTGFLSSWRELFLEGDPYFNPNLSTDYDDYTTELEPVMEVHAGFPIGDAASVRNILVVKLDHIGDFITCLPAVRRLREHFPAARITMLVGRAATTLAPYEPCIDKVMVFEFFEARSGSGYKELTEEDYARLRAQLHAERFDLAVDLRKHADTRHILQYSGARWLAGFNRDAKFPWLDVAIEWEGDSVIRPKRNHVSWDLINLVDGVGNAFKADRQTLRLPQRGKRVALSEELETEFGELFAGRYACIHPSSGTEMRQWRLDYFAILADMLIERDGIRVALIGGPDEKPMAEAILENVRNKHAVHNLVGRSKLSELPEIMMRSALLIGNNSGPHHLAAGLGVPTIGVHSGVVPVEEWGPLGPTAFAMRRDVSCAPCYRGKASECHRGLACLSGVRPVQVYERCSRLLMLHAERPTRPAAKRARRIAEVPK